MKISFIEYKGLKKKDGKYETVQSKEKLTLSRKDFIDLKEQLEIIYNLQEKIYFHCQKCCDKEECSSCLVKQIKFHTDSSQKIIECMFLSEPVSQRPDRPKWMHETKERGAVNKSGHIQKVKDNDTKLVEWKASEMSK